MRYTTYIAVMLLSLAGGCGERAPAAVESDMCAEVLDQRECVPRRMGEPGAGFYRALCEHLAYRAQTASESCDDTSLFTEVGWCQEGRVLYIRWGNSASAWWNFYNGSWLYEMDREVVPLTTTGDTEPQFDCADRRPFWQTGCGCSLPEG